MTDENAGEAGVIVETPAASLADFAELVAKKAAEHEPLWFRGMASAGWRRLVPSLYRHKLLTGADDLLSKETDLIETFRHRAPPFLSESLPSLEDNGDLQVLFIMQHYGIPTRLLDWTENPFVALYFALRKWRNSTPDADPAVWILRPKRLNEVSLSGTSKARDIILPPTHPNLQAYYPSAVERERPVAMYGVHNSKRIVAQRGVFVLFGSDTRGMDEQPEVVGSSVLEKIVLPKAKASEVFGALFRLGFTDSVVFPDLDGLAREVSYQHGY